MKLGRIALVTLLSVLVLVWFPSWRWYALGFVVPLGLILLSRRRFEFISSATRRPMRWMNRPRYFKIDLREAAAWLFQLWP
jgi:hypothetical protein